jgi:outer membrane protein assembly factor BamB
VVKAINDPAPLTRGAAAESLARSGLPAAIDLSRKALADGNADVRLRVALALVTRAKDKSAVPVMIGLMAELPQGSGWRIEDVLVRLAGESAPKVTLGEDAAARQKCRDAWKEWWDKNGAKTDLARLDGAPPMLGNTLLVLRDPRSGAGKVVEINAKKEEIWKIDGLQFPADAVVVGRNRVLIVEQNNHQVSERDFSGKVIWSKQVPLPTGVQRLPNGNTFVTCRNQLVEYDTKQTEVFSYQRQQYDICAAQKLRSGEAVFVTTNGQCTRVDAKGKESKTFPVSRMLSVLGGLEVLPNSHVLVTQRDSVAEYDGTGGAPVWQATYSRPTSVQRLPNGNTLVASGMAAASGVAELDRAGQTVWEYKSTDNFLPYRARRR